MARLGCLSVLAAVAVAVSVAVGAPAKELQLVHLVYRHGTRTPADTYPNDPYLNATFAPFGWGQLTNVGKNEMYESGLYVRSRYDEFLGDAYSPALAHVQSTDSDRTRMSSMLVGAALFPPRGGQRWSDLGWQPVPVVYEPLPQDNLLLVRRPCAQYSLEKERVVAHGGELKRMLDDGRELLRNLTALTGMAVASFEDVQSLYSTLRAEEAFGLALPDWTRDYYPDKLLPFTKMDFVLSAYNNKLKRLKGGVFLKKILADYYNVIQRQQMNEEDLKKALAAFSVFKDFPKQVPKYGKFPKERKIYLYGGHDSTVSNLLSALNVWDPQVPGYGITVLLEFSKDRATNEFGVEIYLRNSTAVPPFRLTVPGCEPFCPLATLTKLLEPVVPYDWDEECRSDDPDYVPPPAGGP